MYLSISVTDHSQTAVIKESLRMAHGVVTPLPRVVGPVDSEISGVMIPAGVKKIFFYSETVDLISSLTDGRFDGGDDFA